MILPNETPKPRPIAMIIPFPGNSCPACERGEKSVVPPATSILRDPKAVHMPSGNICQKFIDPELLKKMEAYHAARNKSAE